MHDKLKSHADALTKIDSQRKIWLGLSVLVIFVVGFTIFDADHLAELDILWSVSAAGIVLTVAWWYWVMRTVSTVITHRVEELEVLTDLYHAVKDLKEDIRKNANKDVD